MKEKNNPSPKQESNNFLQQIGLPHCFTCHKEHEMIHERFYLTPCTEKCGKWFNSPTPTDRILESWEVEFDKLAEMPDDFAKVKESLYSEETYPESEYELCPDKIKSFISQKLLSTRQSTIKEIIDGLPKEKELLCLNDLNEGVNNIVTGFNQAVQEIKQSLEKLAEK